MRLSRRLRQIWHDFYYSKASAKRVSFAMTCKDATAIVDLHDGHVGLVKKIRFWLHMSLCQTCKSYDEFSTVLNKAIRAFAQTTKLSNVDVERLNKDLVQKHSRPGNE